MRRAGAGKGVEDQPDAVVHLEVGIEDHVPPLS
jgi:hypothetical protein